MKRCPLTIGAIQNHRVKVTMRSMMSSEKAWPTEYAQQIWTLYFEQIKSYMCVDRQTSNNMPPLIQSKGIKISGTCSQATKVNYNTLFQKLLCQWFDPRVLKFTGKNAHLEFTSVVFIRFIVGRNHNSVGELSSGQRLLSFLAINQWVELHKYLKIK